MPKATKLTVGQGETLKVLTNLQTESGVALDITGMTFSGSVRETYSSPSISAEFSIEIVPPSSSGSFYFKLTPTQTAALTAQDYVYDLVKIEGTERRRLAEGMLVVRPGVTLT